MAAPAEGDAMGTTPMQGAAHVNALVHRFGESVKGFFRDQRRSSMTSPMFNLPGRLVLGAHCYYEHLGPLLAEIAARCAPAAIGRRMQRLCARPNYVNLNSLALGFLVGREQRRLLGHAPHPDDAERVAQVMTFWEAVARACRRDGHCLPDEADFTIPVLPAAAVEDLAARLRPDPDPDLRARIRRMLATLELYTFILHGEARVGVFHHGPYVLDGGDTLLVKELIGLREDFYPWARLQARPPFAHLACVMRLRAVRSRLVLFGSLTTEPRDYASNVVAEEVLVVDGDAYEPLPHADIDAVTAVAADAQMELYRRVIDWDPRYRIAYGAELYGCLLKAFADDLGLGAEFGERIRARFADSVEQHVEDLLSAREPPLVLQHIAQTPGPIFAPLDMA